MIDLHYIVFFFVAILAVIPFLFEKTDVENKIRNKIIRNTVIAIVIIQAILSSIIYYSEKKQHQIESNIQANMFEMITRINTKMEIDHDQLRKKYPDGYYLYAINQYNIVNTSPNVKIKMNWETSETYISDDGEVLFLVIDQFYYIPKDITFNKLRVLIEKKIGAIADGVFFDNDGLYTGLYVEILDIENDELVVVFGLKQVEILPEITSLKSLMEKHRNKVTNNKTRYINTGAGKGHTIENYTIVSGWLPSN